MQGRIILFKGLIALVFTSIVVGLPLAAFIDAGIYQDKILSIIVAILGLADVLALATLMGWYHLENGGYDEK